MKVDIVNLSLCFVHFLPSGLRLYAMVSDHMDIGLTFDRQDSSFFLIGCVHSIAIERQHASYNCLSTKET